MVRVIALCLMLSGAAFAPVNAQAQPAGMAAQVTPVIVSPVKQKSFSDKVEALGTLKANESVELTSTVTELVTTINFEDNQSVEAGTVLVEMDASEEQAELSEEQSVLAEAQRQVNRLTPLVKKGAASESILDESKREAQAAQARIKAIESRVNQRIVKAPYDGVLGLRNISVGALAQPGTLITTIDDISIMKLDFSVPEVFLSTLKPGVGIEATTEAYPEETFSGRISSVDSRIDPVTRSIQARALIDNASGKLKPGLLMQVELQKDPRETLVVAEEALVPEGSKSFVLVVVEGDGMTTVERREVTVGVRQFGEAEILNGLSEGEQVVTHGTLRARPGAPVKVTAVEDEDQPLSEMLEQGQNQDKTAGEAE